MFTWCYSNLRIKKKGGKKKKVKENLLFFKLQKVGITFSVNFKYILCLLPNILQSTLIV